MSRKRKAPVRTISNLAPKSSFCHITAFIFTKSTTPFKSASAPTIDNSYNYSFGIKEHIIFPEVSFDRADKVREMETTV